MRSLLFRINILKSMKRRYIWIFFIDNKLYNNRVEWMKRNFVHFFVAITTLSLFIMSLFLRRKEKEVRATKKCTEFGFIS